MPVYPYRCIICGAEGDLLRSIHEDGDPDCPDCLARGYHFQMRRVYTPFAFKPSMPEHFNLSTGQYVSNTRDFSEQLKRKSEQENMRHRMMDRASQEAGIEGGGKGVEYEVDLKPVDPADQRDVFGITDEGMEETRRRHRELGWTERRKLFL